MNNTRNELPGEPSDLESVDATGTGNRYSQDKLKGTVIVKVDIMEPVFPKEYWDSLKS